MECFVRVLPACSSPPHVRTDEDTTDPVLCPSTRTAKEEVESGRPTLSGEGGRRGSRHARRASSKCAAAWTYPGLFDAGAWNSERPSSQAIPACSTEEAIRIITDRTQLADLLKFGEEEEDVSCHDAEPEPEREPEGEDAAVAEPVPALRAAPKGSRKRRSVHDGVPIHRPPLGFFCVTYGPSRTGKTTLLLGEDCAKRGDEKDPSRIGRVSLTSAVDEKSSLFLQSFYEAAEISSGALSFGGCMMFQAKEYGEGVRLAEGPLDGVAVVPDSVFAAFLNDFFLRTDTDVPRLDSIINVGGARGMEMAAVEFFAGEWFDLLGRELHNVAGPLQGTFRPVASPLVGMLNVLSAQSRRSEVCNAKLKTSASNFVVVVRFTVDEDHDGVAEQRIGYFVDMTGSDVVDHPAGSLPKLGLTQLEATLTAASLQQLRAQLHERFALDPDTTAADGVAKEAQPDTSAVAADSRHTRWSTFLKVALGSSSAVVGLFTIRAASPLLDGASQETLAFADALLRTNHTAFAREAGGKVGEESEAPGRHAPARRAARRRRHLRTQRHRTSAAEGKRTSTATVEFASGQYEPLPWEKRQSVLTSLVSGAPSPSSVTATQARSPSQSWGACQRLPPLVAPATQNADTVLPGAAADRAREAPGSHRCSGTVTTVSLTDRVGPAAELPRKSSSATGTLANDHASGPYKQQEERNHGAAEFVSYYSDTQVCSAPGAAAGKNGGLPARSPHVRSAPNTTNAPSPPVTTTTTTTTMTTSNAKHEARSGTAQLSGPHHVGVSAREAAAPPLEPASGRTKQPRTRQKRKSTSPALPPSSLTKQPHEHLPLATYPRAQVGGQPTASGGLSGKESPSTTSTSSRARTAAQSARQPPQPASRDVFSNRIEEKFLLSRMCALVEGETQDRTFIKHTEAHSRQLILLRAGIKDLVADRKRGQGYGHLHTAAALPTPAGRQDDAESEALRRRTVAGHGSSRSSPGESAQAEPVAGRVHANATPGTRQSPRRHQRLQSGTKAKPRKRSDKLPRVATATPSSASPRRRKRTGKPTSVPPADSGAAAPSSSPRAGRPMVACTAESAGSKGDSAAPSPHSMPPLRSCLSPRKTSAEAATTPSKASDARVRMVTHDNQAADHCESPVDTDEWASRFGRSGTSSPSAAAAHPSRTSLSARSPTDRGSHLPSRRSSSGASLPQLLRYSQRAAADEESRQAASAQSGGRRTSCSGPSPTHSPFAMRRTSAAQSSLPIEERMYPLVQLFNEDERMQQGLMGQELLERNEIELLERRRRKVIETNMEERLLGLREGNRRKSSPHSPSPTTHKKHAAASAGSARSSPGVNGTADSRSAAGSAGVQRPSQRVVPRPSRIFLYYDEM